MLTGLVERLFEEAEEGTEGSTGEVEEVETSTEEGETEEEGEEAETTNDDDLDEEGIKNAKELYKMLRNPATAKGVVEILAKQNGLLKDTPATPKETAENKKALKEIFKDALGEKYKFLGDELGPAIDAVLKAQENAFNERLSRSESQTLENNVRTEMDKLARDTKNESRKLENKMAELSEKYPHTGKGPLREYIRDLYDLATAQSGKSKTNANIADKIRRNAGDAPSRLAPSGSGETSGKPKEYKNVHDAVAAAAAQVLKRVK